MGTKYLIVFCSLYINKMREEIIQRYLTEKTTVKTEFRGILERIRFQIQMNYVNYDFPKETDEEIAMISVRNDLLFDAIGKCLS